MDENLGQKLLPRHDGVSRAPARGRADSRPEPALRGRRARFEAERGPCTVRSRARRARLCTRTRGELSPVGAPPWQGCRAGHVLGLSG